MSRIIYLVFYVLQHSLCLQGQKAQTMPPVTSCTASVTTLRCPNHFVIIPTSAAYGVAQQNVSCSYTPEDCTADAMAVLACAPNTNECQVYASRKRLPQCNDEYASYMRIEYDCVPSKMDDAANEYNICANDTEITAEHGILTSPGYGSSFQTVPSECYHALRVAKDKAIRLWLTDLRIGGTQPSCPTDAVTVMDGSRHVPALRDSIVCLSGSVFVRGPCLLQGFHEPCGVSWNANVLRNGRPAIE